MSQQLAAEITEECEAHWSRSGMQRATVLRLMHLLEAELGSYDVEHLVRVAADTQQLAETWKTQHRSLVWRVGDAVGYGAAMMAVFLWITHVRIGFTSLGVPRLVWGLGLVGFLVWVSSDIRWSHLRDRVAALMWVGWPVGLTTLIALIIPVSADGSWPLTATALLTIGAGTEAVWSWRHSAIRSPAPPVDLQIEVVVESVVSHGFFQGWPRSGTLAMVSEIRRHLLDAQADGKSPEMVMGRDPDSWVDQWAAASGLTSVRFYAARLVVGLALAVMAVVTFPFLMEGYSEIRIDFALWCGVVVAVGGVIQTTYLSHIWTSIDHRRRGLRCALLLGVALVGVATLAGLVSVQVFGELSASVAWAVPITFAAAVTLLSVGWQDPFRR